MVMGAAPTSQPHRCRSPRSTWWASPNSSRTPWSGCRSAARGRARRARRTSPPPSPVRSCGRSWATRRRLPIEEFRSHRAAPRRALPGRDAPVSSRATASSPRTAPSAGSPASGTGRRDIDPVGTILYLHGGGYIGTSPTMYAFFTAGLARETACEVFVADYRLAPEFPFPAGLERRDRRGRGAARRRASTAERLFVAGDSGGGGLASSLMLPSRAERPADRRPGCILFSPEVDLAPRRAVGHRERRRRHPAVEHPDRGLPPRRRPGDARVAVDRRRPRRLPAHLRRLRRRRDVPRPDPPLRRPARGRRGRPPRRSRQPGMFHVFPILMPWADPAAEVYRDVGRFIAGRLAGHPTYENATDRTATDDGESDGPGATDSGGSDTDDVAADGGARGARRARRGPGPPSARARRRRPAARRCGWARRSPGRGAPRWGRRR